MKKGFCILLLSLALLGDLAYPESVVQSITGTGVYVFGTTGVTMNILALDGSGMVQVTSFPNSGPPNPPTGDKPVDIYWTILNGSGFNSFTGVFTFTYTDSQYSASDITDETTLYAARYDSNTSTWNPYPTIVDTLNNTVSCTANTFILHWGIGGTGGSLPVTLASFTAVRQSGQVQLNWTTYCEQDNLGFNILRSSLADGPFNRINTALIPGANTTSQPQTYKFIDYTALNTTYWYKVEQLDLGGARTLSGAVQAAGETNIDDLALPAAINPGPGSVYNLLGRRMDNRAGLQPGIYLILDAQGKITGKKAIIE